MIYVGFRLYRVLTPPRTPLFSSSDTNQSLPNLPRNTSLPTRFLIRLILSFQFLVSQSESNYSSRPAGSRSVTRFSVSLLAEFR